MKRLMGILLVFAFFSSCSQERLVPDVTLSGEEGKSGVAFEVISNLPSNTLVLLSLSSEGGNYSNIASGTVTDGKVLFGPFVSSGEAPPSGQYKVVVTIPTDSRQASSVRSALGDRGQNLAGEYVVGDQVSKHWERTWWINIKDHGQQTNDGPSITRKSEASASSSLKLAWDFDPSISERQKPIVAKILAIIEDLSPGIRKDPHDVVSARVAITPATAYRAERYGWNKEVWITLKVRENATYTLISGHTLDYFIGANGKPGIVAQKVQAHWFMGMDAKRGEESFRAYMPLDIVDEL